MGCHGTSAEVPVHLRSWHAVICTTEEVAQLPFSDVGRVQLSPLQVEVRPPRFNLQSLFTWCLLGFTLKCLFSLVLPIPTSFSQAVTPAQLPHFTASSKPSSDVGLPSPTLSKGASHHFHHNIFPLAPSFSLAFWILGESWLLGSAVTTPNITW